MIWYLFELLQTNMKDLEAVVCITIIASSVLIGGGVGYYRYTNEDILNQYPGIFLTESEIKLKMSRFLALRVNYLQAQGIKVNDTSYFLGDGDSCCETKIENYINYTMKNTLGQTKFIVHLPPKYQYIPQGSCVAKGNCNGLCVLEPVIHTLLAYDIVTGVIFDQFIIPGYCSCKQTNTTLTY